MDKAAVLEIARKYADEVVKVMSPDKILLYGSYAKGNAREESDIDIAVIYDGFTGDTRDWFQDRVNLSRLVWDVSTYIEPVLLDVQDDRSGFVREVLRTGEVVYQQE